MNIIIDILKLPGINILNFIEPVKHFTRHRQHLLSHVNCHLSSHADNFFNNQLRTIFGIVIIKNELKAVDSILLRMNT
eukprot:UN17198